jgi:para-aminobenzoate synthetase/4-amino-4-deoxychorismate lyase
MALRVTPAAHGAADPAPLANLSPPFVLLEDRLDRTARARLYRDPVDIVSCDRPECVAGALHDIEQATARGLHAAGFFSYELGYVLEPRLAALLPTSRDVPLLWFGLFEPPQRFPAKAMDQVFGELAPPPPVTELAAAHDRAEHTGKMRRILDLIRAGDIYQANLTFPLRFRFAGDPLALYAALRARQPVAHGGVVAFADRMLLSVSPELFVEAAGGQATARPMKGTAARGADPSADLAASRALAADPKQRAENLMIVDLLRNDLARIGDPGTVRTPALFTVESYPTFHALTSTITASLRADVGLTERIGALFPCGSIVGAPKIRAGEVIRELEAEPRGAYTGAIGVIEPGGDMAFNVAIRTAILTAGGAGRYGVGGGVVADSDPDAEYDEALLKARVLSDLAEDYGLIETFRWTPAQGFVRLAGHLDRLARSARGLGFVFHAEATKSVLARYARPLSEQGENQRVRLVLARTGALTLTHQRLGPQPAQPLRVGVATERLDAGDPFLRHKTTHRPTHELAFARAQVVGWDEILLLNGDGEVADGSRHSIFVEIGAQLVTPPISDGALPGVLRSQLIEDGRAVGRSLSLADLRRAERWFVGNSLHGLRPAVLDESAAAARDQGAAPPQTGQSGSAPTFTVRVSADSAS